MIFRRGHQILCGLLALLPLHGVLSAAGAYVSPESIDGATVINAEQLIELAGSQADLVIVDSRIREDYVEGHIEGSTHLVDGDTTAATADRRSGAGRGNRTARCRGRGRRRER